MAMNIRYLSAIIILSIMPMGCATNQERPASETRAGTAQREMTRGQRDPAMEQLMRSEQRQIYRHYRALDRMQAEQQWQESRR
jgi:hypothetical protein